MVLVFRFAVSALVLAPGFKPRTILQLIIGMLFVFVYLLLVVRADPMLQRENNSFNSFVILQLLFTVSVRVLYSVVPCVLKRRRRRVLRYGLVCSFDCKPARRPAHLCSDTTSCS